MTNKKGHDTSCPYRQNGKYVGIWRAKPVIMKMSMAQ